MVVCKKIEINSFGFVFTMYSKNRILIMERFNPIVSPAGGFIGLNGFSVGKESELLVDERRHFDWKRIECC